MESVYKAIDAHCRACGKCSLNIMDLRCVLLETLREKGKLDEGNCPQYFISNCIKKENVIRAANLAYARVNDDTDLSTELLAKSFAELSGALKSRKKAKDKETKKNKTLTAKAMCCLSVMGIKGDRIKVTGQRKITVTLYNINPESLVRSGKEIRDRLSLSLCAKMSTPKIISSGQKFNMVLNSVPRIQTESKGFSVTKAGEKICGDTVRAFNTANGYSYFLICDGMGSGKEASLSSKLAASALENLLTIGVDADTALQMVNSMLISSSDETFTTADLLEIDIYSAKARIIKAGAAPTYTVSTSDIVKTDVSSMPLGIIEPVRSVSSDLAPTKGIYFIMLSDGAVSGTSDEDLLISTVSKNNYSGASELALNIYETIRSNRMYSDDVSVCVIKISEIST